MASYLQIPLQASVTDQTLSIGLDDTSYILRVLWNERGQYFSLSIATADDEPILTNIKMVKDFPLFGGFRDSRLPFGEFFLVQENGEASAAGYDDLGTAFVLYYVEPDVVADTAPMLDEPVAPALGSTWDGGDTVWDAGLSLWDK